MTWLNVADARCALFASPLQASDQPSADLAVAAIGTALRDLGVSGCVGLMAQEFGDHPDAAAARMRWASELATELDARQAAPGAAEPGAAEPGAAEPVAS